MPTFRVQPFAELIGALRFLTRLPVPFARTVVPVPLAQAMRMFPVCGAVLGAATGLVLCAGFSVGLPALPAAALACVFATLITGALHEDGLADTADGFGGGRDLEHRLAIMRDSRIGTYGTVALILAYLLRVTALEPLLAQPLWVVMLAGAAAGAFSRAMMVDLMWASRPARSDGVSAYVGRPSRGVTLFAIFTGALVTLACSFVAAASGVLALAAGTLATAAVRLLATRLIGGQTGDVCGAVQVTSECAMLLVLAATFP